jgi:hypothetical protein
LRIWLVPGPASARYDERGWRATFYTSGMEHSPTSGATGTGWGRTPWYAVQRAVWEALKKTETNVPAPAAWHPWSASTAFCA